MKQKSNHSINEMALETLSSSTLCLDDQNKSLSKKKLVILTNFFGTNFSGGSTATCRIFEPIQNDFSEIIVIAKKTGDHRFNRIRFLPYQTIIGAIKHIRQLKKESQIIFYGDFYLAFYYILASVPFYFTFHDNWPEQKKLNLQNYLKSFFYIPIYQWILKNAEWVINVSLFKLKYSKRFTSKTSLIRNGIDLKITKRDYQSISKNKKVNIIMLGNIENRKFGLAPKVFRMIAMQSYSENISIEIYGKILDEKLTKKLSSFDFVHLKGFSKEINFSNHDLMLSTSQMENLSIAVCEALFNHTPVICFDVGGLNEVIKHEENGILIKDKNIPEMVDWIGKITSGFRPFDFRNQELSSHSWDKASQQYKKLIIDKT